MKIEDLRENKVTDIINAQGFFEHEGLLYHKINANGFIKPSKNIYAIRLCDMRICSFIPTLEPEIYLVDAKIVIGP